MRGLFAFGPNIFPGWLFPCIMFDPEGFQTNAIDSPTMGPFHNSFSIRSMEEFSGVKAHTIRIWEKRYGLLTPDRTGTNIRHYSLDELKVILNVAYLNRHGHKISRIAAMTLTERDRLVRETAGASNSSEETLNSLKLAMLAFDEAMFDRVTAEYSKQHGFRHLVESVFVPLLEHIGMLWQTNVICPAQEHFVSNLIRQKLITATDGLTAPTGTKDRTFVLYLPENEIHELGLLYVNYLLRARDEHTIFLGQSVPSDDLKHLAAVRNGQLVMVTILMGTPPAGEIPAYLSNLRASLPDGRIRFLVTGAQLAKVEEFDVPPGVQTFPSMRELVKALDEL